MSDKSSEGPGSSQPARPVRPSHYVDDVGPREARLRLRSVGVGSVLGYAALWSVLMILAFVLMVFLVHVGLDTMGVLASVSEGVSTLLGQPVPTSGLLPYLEQDAVVKGAFVLGAVLAVLSVLFAVTATLAHNVISWMTGGLRLTFRE